MTKQNLIWLGSILFSLNLFGQSESIKLLEDKLANIKWSAELNEGSSYFAPLVVLSEKILPS